MSKRVGLGRGLDALIPNLEVREEDKVLQIAVDKLRPNPYQPRKQFDESGLQELADSIREHGVIQPIIVRAVLKGYEIIAGERRWRASKQLGLPHIPAVQRAFSDQQVMEIALIENLQREDLNAIEIAVAYQGLIDQFKITQEELSLKVGKSRSHVANFLRLLQLPSEIKEYVSRGTLTMGHARAILGLDAQQQRVYLANEAIKQSWSVRELESRIKQMSESDATKKKKTANKAKDPFIANVEDELRTLLHTTVKIKEKQDKGRIEISYYSKEDLQRIIELLQS